MSHLKFTSCVLILISLFLSSCLNSPDEPKIYSDVEGLVTQNGEPVADAGIHFRSHYNPGGFPEGEEREAEIQLNIMRDGIYKFNLYRFGTLELLGTVFEDSLESGNQSVVIADSLLTNGIYIYQIITPQNQRSESTFLVNKPDSSLVDALPVTYTNAEGGFEFDAEILLIDGTVRSEEETSTITDSLQIIVTKDEQIIGKGFLKVGTENNNFIEISVD